METLKSLTLSGFHVHLRSFAPSYTCPWPERVAGRLCVFLAGGMQEKSMSYEASDVVYRPPEDRPRLRFGDRGARTVTIELRKAGLEMLRSAGFDVDAPYSVRSAQCHAVAERVGAELSERDEMTPLVLEGLVFDLFTRMHRSKRAGAPPRWLVEVRERIEAEYPKPWTLKDYAEGAGVHPVHLAARFRAHYGATVGEQIRARRVRHAMERLQETARPISEISLEAGFSDQSHLSRVFKKQTGQTPGQFRSTAL